ncbi:uncharacterized protein LOC131167998 [Malania oleifera]|uniref:uncharacterized protein LOC131167998 n=1 Tax=Malania oleifera TaxID=397392 RepID=UPI0025AEC237|nr:uncharacterized protein LOC131167998 [Malania oleifera]
MGDETPGTMNLDLNLGPLFPPPSPSRELGSGSGLLLGEPANLADWVEEQPVRRRITEAVRPGTRQRWRWQQVQIPPETRNISMELIGNSGGDGSGSQTGEGSAAAEERVDVPTKTCEHDNGDMGDEALGKTEDVEKGCSNEGSFFDCNICLDLAWDPVLTCCGHLFCWPCLYRWLHIHSDAKECPVCKGEVTDKSVTPIFGRGNNSREPEEDFCLKIPPRPQARRVESLRQNIQRNSFSFSMEEMFRRLGSRFDLTRDLIQSQDADGARDMPERTSSLLNRILTSRGMRREQSAVVPPDDVVDLTPSSITNLEGEDNRQLTSLQILRRAHTHRAAAFSSLSSALSSAERLVEAYFRSHPVGRNQEQPPPVEDRDSFSSIGAVIHSGSQTMDTAIEIDSTVALSTSSSRRRYDASRTSDVDSGDSRAPRRRRMN